MSATTFRKTAMSICMAIAALFPMRSQHIPGHGSIRGLTTGVLLVLTDQQSQMYRLAQAVIGHESLVDWQLDLWNLDIAKLSPKSATSLYKSLPALPWEGWAIVLPSGYIPISGNGPIDHEMIESALRKANVMPPIERLRKFLQLHPNHIEAREHLLRQLKQTAITKTDKLLNIQPSKVLMMQLFQAGAGDPNSPLFEMPDMEPFIGKTLSDEDDKEIWGDFAAELNAAFQNGRWQKMDLCMHPLMDPMTECCSPTVKAIYARHINRVEQVLEQFPFDSALWDIWARMALSGGNAKRGQNLLDRLHTPPPELGLQWPPSKAVKAIAMLAANSEDWVSIQTLLAPALERWDENMQIKRRVGPSSLLSYDGGADWDYELSLLIQSFLKSGKTGQAQAIVDNFAEFSSTRGLIPKAAAIAKSCGLPDLAERWLELEKQSLVAEFSKKDPLASFRAGALRHKKATLVVVGLVDAAPYESVTKNADVLSLGLLSLHTMALQQAWRTMGQVEARQQARLTGELVDYYGLIPKIPRWFMLDPFGNVVAGEDGVPKPNDILEAFKKTGCISQQEALARYKLQYQDNPGVALLDFEFGANIGQSKTKSALGLPLDKPYVEGKLAEGQDEAIWWTYAKNAGRFFPKFLEIDPFNPANPNSLAKVIPDCVPASGKLVQMSDQARPSIEGAIADKPSSIRLWSFFLAFGTPNYKKVLPKLFASLVPSPMTPESEWPPRYLVSPLLECMKGEKMWEGIIQIAEPTWSEHLQMAADSSVPFTEAIWERATGPLLEAYIQTGRIAQAEELLENWPSNGWPGAWKKAQRLADDANNSANNLRLVTLIERLSKK